jgi:hypothetical protein
VKSSLPAGHFLAQNRDFSRWGNRAREAKPAGVTGDLKIVCRRAELVKVPLPLVSTPDLTDVDEGVGDSADEPIDRDGLVNER